MTPDATAPKPQPGFRIEKDPLGYLEVPDGAYYGVQTARGIHNFPISGTRPHPALVRPSSRSRRLRPAPT